MDEFAAEVAGQDLHLARACLLLARDEHPDLHVEEELARFEPWTERVHRLRVHNVALPEALRQTLALEQGFAGNRDEYYDPENSMLDSVLERRTGIPITLSIVYLEVARRLGEPLVAVGMPGHFLVRHEQTLLDPFHHGRELSADECQRMLDAIYGGQLQLREEMLEAVSDREVLARVLANLKLVYAQQGDAARTLRTVERILQVHPFAFPELRDRGLLRLALGQPGGREDLERYLDAMPAAPDAPKVRALLRGR